MNTYTVYSLLQKLKIKNFKVFPQFSKSEASVLSRMKVICENYQEKTSKVIFLQRRKKLPVSRQLVFKYLLDFLSVLGKITGI